MMNYSREILDNATTTPMPDFGYFSLFITLFFLTPAFIFNILLLVAIIAEKTLPGTIRFILCNIITASQVVIFGLAVILVMNIIPLTGQIFVCRLLYVTLTSGAAARLEYMATFTIIVYILVRHGPAKLHFRITFLVGLVLWVLAIIPNTALFSPDVLKITLIDGNDCAASSAKTSALIFSFTYILVYGLGSFTIAILLPIVMVCYIRKNTISGDTKLLKGMIKFAIFLLVGNSMNFIGISIPLLFATFAPSGEEYYTMAKSFNYAESIFIMLSLIPTPIIILIFFKPVRHRLKKIVCFHCVRKVGGSRQMFLTLVKGAQKMEVHAPTNIPSPVDHTDQIHKESLAIL